MLKPFGLSVVVSGPTLARVTIVGSPVDMITLSTLEAQMSISAHYHSRKLTKRQLRYQFVLKEVVIFLSFLAGSEEYRPWLVNAYFSIRFVYGMVNKH